MDRFELRDEGALSYGELAVYKAAREAGWSPVGALALARAHVRALAGGASA